VGVLICTSCGHGNGEGAKFCEECGVSFAVASVGTQVQRKTVTVLFCDLTGSTALGETLDPERLRALLARYFERMKAIVERHGGSVEKFIGDAVMAVFGVPVLHEDDALRAVRAAVEMRDALPELGLRGRIGVMTGEVVTGTQERLATGDAVNVAARLEQAAQPGEVLVGGPTSALVRGATDVEPVEPLELKGKSDPVPAYRLLRVRDAPERRHEALFVGRTGELVILREAWERVRGEQRCELVTITGDAGVGKSRLAVELLASIEATVVRGRCLPYGEGITYWPVVEVLKQLDLPPAEDAAAAAIRSLLGETDSATSAEELAWAFRKAVERAAAERPLVVVFDDIQWGEETFLDLIEHVALLSAGASILVFCMARPELAERRPTWPVTLRLDPLGDEDVDELIPERIPGELRDKIVRAAGGNPLFIEEMVAMAGEAEGDVVVPPTLQALLGARLDQLETGERGVLERGAIEGEVFHQGAVEALAPEETQVTPRLAALVRKALIRSDRPQLPGEDAFRFRHLLIRDAAYDALSKAIRAELHERFASWLEHHGTELVELDEILGYHLEQACRYRAELGTADDGILAASARRRLTAAGRRAHVRADYGAAVSLFERASALVNPARLDLVLETELIDALSGRAMAKTRCTARTPSPSVRLRRAIVSPSSAGRSRGACSASPSSQRARRSSCPRSSNRLCPYSRPPATIWLCTSPTPRLRRWRACAGRWGQGWRPSSAPSPTLGRRATYRLSPVPLAPMRASSARLPCWNYSPGLTRTSQEPGGTTGSVPTRPGRWRCSVVSTTRARSSPKRVRSWRSAAGESCSRTSPPSSPSGLSSGPTSPPPQPSSEQQGSGCSRSSGN
jgi:class 3 adenylate cyclase